jgi:hypothetical protein
LKSNPKLVKHSKPSDTTVAVDTFIAELVHPCKPEVVAIRGAILSVDSSVLEGIKWNAPSFRTSEYFATTNLRQKMGVGVILHLGAKIRDLPEGGVCIHDPKALLKWLGKDRASVEFTDVQDLDAKKEAFQAVLRQWIRYV